MKSKFEIYARIFKAISDPKRLRIVEMLSCGELCACKILEEFKITQPTLSHDMKLLCEAGLLTSRREGKWMYYSLNKQNIQELRQFVMQITSEEPAGTC